MMPKKASAFPKARRFAVVRMDPVAMVEHLHDPVALNAARAMRTKKYLVYLEFVSTHLNANMSGY